MAFFLVSIHAEFFAPNIPDTSPIPQSNTRNAAVPDPATARTVSSRRAPPHFLPAPPLTPTSPARPEPGARRRRTGLEKGLSIIGRGMKSLVMRPSDRISRAGTRSPWIPGGPRALMRFAELEVRGFWGIGAGGDSRRGLWGLGGTLMVFDVW